MLAKNAESSLAGLGFRLIRQPRQPINSETEFAKASQGPANEFIVRDGSNSLTCPFSTEVRCKLATYSLSLCMNCQMASRT